MTRRLAYTLFELVLVLAVLVVLGSLSIPLMQTMLADNRVPVASDMIRTAWAEARARAVAEGRPYRFGVQNIEGGGLFQVAPDSPEFWEGSVPADPGEGMHDDGKVLVGKLPRDILFASEAEPAAGGWSGLITFRLDGTAEEDAAVSFTNQGGQPALTLRLRGLTGAVTAEGPASESARP
jgi:hypothetical protein